MHKTLKTSLLACGALLAFEAAPSVVHAQTSANSVGGSVGSSYGSYSTFRAGSATTMSNIFSGNSNTRTATGRTLGIASDPNQLRTGTGMVGTSTGQRIIGANATGGPNAQTANRGNTNRRNNNNNGQNFANMLQQLGQNGQQQNNMAANRGKPPLQPQYKVAFETQPYQHEVVARDLNKVLTSDSKAKVFVRNMKLESQPEGVVVMHGEVATEQQRKMAELMVRLEPGVKKVENHLTIHPAPKQ